MSCNNEVRQNDLGTEFLVSIVSCIDGVKTALDISTATDKQIIFLKPNGTLLTKTAIFTPVGSGGSGTGSDGKISYFSIAGDLDQLGTHKIQGIVTTAGGRWSSTVDKFKVKKNLS